MTENLLQHKSELRVMMKQRITNLLPDQKMAESAAIWQKAQQLPRFSASQNVLVYWSMASEVHSHLFVERWAPQKNIYLPLVVGDHLELVRFDDRHQLAYNHRYGIWEPRGEVLTDVSAIDLVFVPGVAFDEHGFRLGRGGGFYDRFLPHVNNSLKVGVAFSCQMVDVVPRGPFDVKMDLVLSGY